ncbi:MAG TPA: twin-arginine translocase TatA/TatE family subunit [Mycobacteriales bacterium]|nr:twin-arginine translocase TatA/TatE family subunit [Mycobacteriales bacterium]
MLGFNWPELLVIGLVGFFVFGPERLPVKIREATLMLRKLRDMAQSATDDLKAQLPDGDDLGLSDLRELRELHPRRIMSRALFDDEPATVNPTPAVGVEAAASGASAAPMAVVVGAVPPYDVDAT